MLRSLIRNPLVINPLTIWLRGILSFLMTKIKYPTIQMQNNVLVHNTVFGKHVSLYNDVRVYQCHIGDFSYIAERSTFVATRIGKFCSIGQGVGCGLGRHPATTFVSTHPAFYSVHKQAQISFADKPYFEEFLPVEIGNDVWIGANAIIVGGIKIGDGAIIAAGAVVTKDVPPYAIVGGVPGSIIRYRFKPEEIDFLLNFKWWDKDETWIKEHWRDMHDIERLTKIQS